VLQFLQTKTSYPSDGSSGMNTIAVLQTGQDFGGGGD
jgi:hypothetical protein